MLKKSRRVIVIVILILLVAVLSSCKSNKQEPSIKISYDSEELSTIYYGNLYNKKQEDIEKRIKDYMVGKRFIDLPSIAFEEVIQVEALNFDTKEYEIYDYIVDEHGNIVSEYDIDPYIISSEGDENAEFIFDKGLNTENYLDFSVEGKLTHCLLIRCSIDNSSFAFATLVLSYNE